MGDKPVEDEHGPLFATGYKASRTDWLHYFRGTGPYTFNPEVEDTDQTPIQEAIQNGGFDLILNAVVRECVLRRNRLIKAGYIDGKPMLVKDTEDYDDDADLPAEKPLLTGKAALITQIPTVAPTPTLTHHNKVLPLSKHEYESRKNGTHPGKLGSRSYVMINRNGALTPYDKASIRGSVVKFQAGLSRYSPAYLEGATVEIVDITSTGVLVKPLTAMPVTSRIGRATEPVSINFTNIVPFLAEKNW